MRWLFLAGFSARRTSVKPLCIKTFGGYNLVPEKGFSNLRVLLATGSFKLGLWASGPLGLWAFPYLGLLWASLQLGPRCPSSPRFW